jgi:hypothetical protein
MPNLNASGGDGAFYFVPAGSRARIARPRADAMERGPALENAGHPGPMGHGGYGSAVSERQHDNAEQYKPACNDQIEAQNAHPRLRGERKLGRRQLTQRWHAPGVTQAGCQKVFQSPAPSNAAAAA